MRVLTYRQSIETSFEFKESGANPSNEDENDGKMEGGDNRCGSSEFNFVMYRENSVPSRLMSFVSVFEVTPKRRISPQNFISATVV